MAREGLGDGVFILAGHDLQFGFIFNCEVGGSPFQPYVQEKDAFLVFAGVLENSSTLLSFMQGAGAEDFFQCGSPPLEANT